MQPDEELHNEFSELILNKYIDFVDLLGYNTYESFKGEKLYEFKRQADY